MYRESDRGLSAGEGAGGECWAAFIVDLTPVNLFRVVLNGYFDARLAMLPDRVFFTSGSRLVFEDVTRRRLRPGAAEKVAMRVSTRCLRVPFAYA